MAVNDKSGTTQRLLQLCAGYFACYVVTGVTVKYFLGSASKGFPGLKGIEFLVYSTVAANLAVLSVVLILRWYRYLGDKAALAYIVPSGVCTAVIIPTTTLMYTLPISVLVAMVIMRGSVIVISRVVDAIQIRQGILHKTVYFQENVAVAFALGAVAVHLVFAGKEKGSFDFVGNTAAMVILGSYVTAYAIRIYIMNYYKNTRPPAERGDNRGFFATEQIAASASLMLTALVVFNMPSWFGITGERIELFRGAILDPRPVWDMAMLAGTAFGAASFFSVFIFMFKGRTATFAGLVNRLTSLIAGTTATLIFHYGFGGRFPKPQDWISLGFILVAVGFLTKAERRRAAEVARGEG